MLVVRVEELPGPRLVEAELTICHLMWSLKLKVARMWGHSMFAIVVLV
jgi:hypothetical protein